MLSCFLRMVVAPFQGVGCVSSLGPHVPAVLGVKHSDTSTRCIKRRPCKGRSYSVMLMPRLSELMRRGY